jgi:hypothetical protein
MTAGVADRLVRTRAGPPAHAILVVDARFSCLVDRLERILGSGLLSSFIAMPTNNDLNATTPAVLRHKARFVAIVHGNKKFLGLLDRNELIGKTCCGAHKGDRNAGLSVAASVRTRIRQHPALSSLSGFVLSRMIARVQLR